jgi:hypothetical protein
MGRRLWLAEQWPRELAAILSLRAVVFRAAFSIHRHGSAWTSRPNGLALGESAAGDEVLEATFSAIEEKKSDLA